MWRRREARPRVARFGRRAPRLVEPSTTKFLKDNNAAKEICPSTFGCSQAELDRHAELVDDATRARTVSFIGFGAGAALTTAAVVVLLTRPSPSKSGQRAPAVPATFQASRSGFSLSLQGEF